MKNNKNAKRMPFIRRSNQDIERQEDTNSKALKKRISMNNSQQNKDVKEVKQNTKVKKGLKVAGIVLLAIFTLAYFVSPGKAELNKVIDEQQIAIEKLETKVIELEKLEERANQTEELEARISEKDKEISDLNAKVASLEKENNNLSDEIASTTNNKTSTSNKSTSSHETSQSSSGSDKTVYVTNSGSKYHTSGCQYLRSSKIAISLSSAKASYSPCSRCHPPT